MSNNKQSMKALKCEYKKLIKLRDNYRIQCEKMKTLIMQDFIIDEEELEKNGEQSLKYCCSVFNHSGDGLVFEVLNFNAPLEKVVSHIVSKGQLTFQEYKDFYTI